MRAGLTLVAPLLLLGACSQLNPHPDWVETPAAQDLDRVLTGEVLFERPIEPDELPDYALMALSPMMELLAEELAYQYSDPYQRAQALHQTLMSSAMGGRGLRYSAMETAPAAQAFADRQVNCLSYSLIFVAMARHMGLRAEINDVAVPPSWNLRDDDSFLFFRHVNSKVYLPDGDHLIVDLEMEQYSPNYHQSAVSDEGAAAQFHNNRGMELLAEGAMREGFLHLRKALELDDQQSYIWGNLGTLYTRQGHYREAEAAFLQGLALNPRDLTVVSNLSTLYRSLNEPDKADYFFRVAREHRTSNPYYLYAKARERLAAGDVGGAQQFLEDALNREQKEPRFYALAAEIYERRELPEKAEQMRAQQKRWSDELYL